MCRAALGLLAALLVLMAGASPASGAGTGTIKGKVTALSGGAPIEGVEVCAYELTGAEEEACRTTKVDGTYSIPGLSAGGYVVEFWPGSAGLNYLPQYYDHRESFEEADEITLSTGGTVENVNAQLEAGAGVAGTVFSAESGAPLPGTEVCVFRALSGEVLECEPTDIAGSYELVGLEEGPHKVAFSIELREIFGPGSFEPEDDGYPTQYYDGKPTFAAADTLNLTPPAVLSGIDAHLFKPSTPLTVTTLTGLGLKSGPEKRSCRKGFRRRRVKGKLRCVKVHRHRHHRGGHRGRIPARLLLHVR